jgi:hypothetical protein
MGTIGARRPWTVRRLALLSAALLVAAASTLSTPSGPNGVWHVVPGTTADVTVFTSSGNSSTFRLKITG